MIVPEGKATQDFTFKTFPVASPQTGDVVATLGAVSKSATLTVRRIGLSSISLLPTTQVGGLSVAGKATLECSAALGPIDVQLASNKGGCRLSRRHDNHGASGLEICRFCGGHKQSACQNIGDDLWDRQWHQKVEDA